MKSTLLTGAARPHEFRAFAFVGSQGGKVHCAANEQDRLCARCYEAAQAARTAAPVKRTLAGWIAEWRRQGIRGLDALEEAPAPPDMAERLRARAAASATAKPTVRIGANGVPAPIDMAERLRAQRR